MRSRSMLKSFSTASTFCPDPFLAGEQLCQRSYLIQKSNMLMHDIHCVQGQKSYYQNQLQTQLRNNTEEKQRLIKLLSEKGIIILSLEEQLERERKQIRLLTDDYLSMKTKLESERDNFNRQIAYLEASVEEKLKQLREKLEQQHLDHIQTVIAEINQSCSKKLKLKDEEIEIIKSSRQSIGLQLQKAQEQYRLLLIKQSGMASEELHNELRKRDRQERERYNLDAEYKLNIKKQNKELKEEVQEKEKQINGLKDKIKGLKVQVSNLSQQNQTLKSRSKQDHQNRHKQSQHKENMRELEDQGLISTIKIKPNQNSLNVHLPLDLQLMASLQSLKEFLDESLIEILVDLFQRSSSQSGKQKSASFNTFDMNLLELKKQKRQLSLIIYTSIKLRQILKEQWPVSQSIPMPTLKQNFIKTCLQESEALKNRPNQQLYRLVELIYRIRNPINHSNSLVNVSDNTLHYVYDKTVGAGAKVFY